MKSYVISVSLGTGCYRHIQISASATLHRLHKAIIDSFDFDDDHLYIFFMDNHYWSHDRIYVREKMDPTDRLAKNCKLETLNLSKGTQFKYIFDLGDEWRFQCKVLRELDIATDIPGVIRRVGDSPEQYPDWEDEDWDDDWDDEFKEVKLQEYCEKLRRDSSLEEETIHLITQYVEAAGRLYGLISLFALQHIYTSQNGPVEDMDFITAAMIGSATYHSCTIRPRDDMPMDTPAQALIAYEVVADYLFVDDEKRDIRNLRNGQRGKPLKQLPKAEFLKYADPCYFPSTPQQAAMLKYLRKWTERLSMDPETFCYCLQSVIVTDAPTDEVFRLAGESGLVFKNAGEMQEFALLYQQLNNHTHKHVNRGHTPDALFMQSPRGQRLAERNAPENQMSLFELPAKKPKLTLTGAPLRNAPCPCGSGRKYKNCCGK